MKPLDIEGFGPGQVVPSLDNRDDMDDMMDVDKAALLKDAKDMVPSKYVAFEEDMKVKVMVRYVDLDGLSDGRSIKTILPQVA